MKGNTGTRTFDRTVLGYQSQHMRNVCAPSASPSNDTKVIISMLIFLRGVIPPENMYVYEGGRSAFRGSLQDVGCAEAMHSPTDPRHASAGAHDWPHVLTFGKARLPPSTEQSTLKIKR